MAVTREWCWRGACGWSWATGVGLAFFCLFVWLDSTVFTTDWSDLPSGQCHGCVTENVNCTNEFCFGESCSRMRGLCLCDNGTRCVGDADAGDGMFVASFWACFTFCCTCLFGGLTISCALSARAACMAAQRAERGYVPF